MRGKSIARSESLGKQWATDARTGRAMKNQRRSLCVGTSCLAFLSVLLIAFPVLVASLACDCGIENIRPRIVNGTRVPDNVYPWIVYIQTQVGGGRAAACTGSIINDRFILTAAHCVYPGETQDPDGVLVFRGPSCLDEIRTTIPMTVKAIHKHPGYSDSADSSDDIALLQLWQPLAFDSTFRPICLPNFEDFDNFFAAGYGRTNFGYVLIGSKCLKEATLDETDGETCQKMDPNFDKSASLCVGNGRSAACNGDSGGALMTRRSGRVYAAGIASTASLDCGTMTRLPNVYERTKRHVSWIREKTQDAVWCRGPHVALP